MPICSKKVADSSKKNKKAPVKKKAGNSLLAENGMLAISHGISIAPKQAYEPVPTNFQVSSFGGKKKKK